MADLTAKQNQFVLEYLVDLNAAQAAIRAGYSERTAGRIAYQLLRMPHVQAALSEAIEAQQKRTGITADRILAELAKVAFADSTNYAQVIGQSVVVTDTSQLTPDQKAAIAGIEETKWGIKVSTYDKVKALELLGKHLGMFTEKVAIAAIDPKAVEEVEEMLRDAEAGG